VIEYQHRGLPHAHIVVRLDNHPLNAQDKLAFIAQHICARYTSCGAYEDAETHERYQQLIRGTMTHRCAQAVNGCLNKAGVCKRGYKTRPCGDRDYMDERGIL
jgi:hypothetical protein